MKKVFAVVLALALVFSMCACGKASGPEGTMQGFCDAMKTLDFNKMKDYVVGGLDAEELDMSEVPDAFMSILKGWAKDLKYKINKAETNGSESKVKVDFTYTDAGPVIKAALGDYITKAIGQAISGNMSEDAMVKLLVECIEAAQKTTKTESKDISMDFYLEQIDGKWAIVDAPADLAKVLLSNFIDSVGGLFQ